jgi:glucokinase
VFHPDVNAQTPFLGIEIGGTKLQIVVGDAAAVIVDRQRFTVDRTRGAPGIRQQLESALPSLVAKWKPAAVGVGFGGPLDSKSGRIARSHHVEGWLDFDLSGWLNSITGLPVFADNDANVAALGEARCGAGAGFNPVFYVTLGSGVGGGLVVDGHVYHGTTPGESEIGHLRLDRSGTILENRCSGWAVDAKVRSVLEARKPGSLSERGGEARGGEAKWLSKALEQGESWAREILDDTAEDLALGLSHVVHLFHPEIIIIGGGLSLIGEPLRAAVAGSLPNFLMEAFRPGPDVRLAALGEDAVPVGALLLAGKCVLSR